MNIKTNKISILGTEYTIDVKKYDEEPLFKKECIDGYCDDTEKVICICDAKTHPNFVNENDEYCEKIDKETLRHEIIHAFLSESGLRENSGRISNIGWAKNEEMVDWIAIQFTKISKAFEECDCVK